MLGTSELKKVCPDAALDAEAVEGLLTLLKIEPRMGINNVARRNRATPKT